MACATQERFVVIKKTKPPPRPPPPKIASSPRLSSSSPRPIPPSPRPPPPKVSPRPPPPRVSPSSTKTNGSRHALSSQETSQFLRQHRENKKPSLDSSLSVSLSSLNFQHNPRHTRRLSDTTLANKPITPPSRPRTRPVPPKNIQKSLVSPPLRPIPPRNLPDPKFDKLRTISSSDLTPRPQATEHILLPTESFRSHTMTKIQSPRPPPVIRNLTKTAPPTLKPKSIHHVTSEENKNEDIYAIPGQVIITEDAEDPDMIPWYASSDNAVQESEPVTNLEQLVQNDDPSLLTKDNNSELQTALLSIPDNDFYTLPDNLTTNDQSDYVSLAPTLREEDSVYTAPTSPSPTKNVHRSSVPSPPPAGYMSAGYMSIVQGNKEDSQYQDLNTSNKPVKPIKPVKPVKKLSSQNLC